MMPAHSCFNSWQEPKTRPVHLNRNLGHLWTPSNSHRHGRLHHGEVLPSHRHQLFMVRQCNPHAIHRNTSPSRDIPDQQVLSRLIGKEIYNKIWLIGKKTLYLQKN